MEDSKLDRAQYPTSPIESYRFEILDLSSGKSMIIDEFNNKDNRYERRDTGFIQ